MGLESENPFFCLRVVFGITNVSNPCYSVRIDNQFKIFERFLVQGSMVGSLFGYSSGKFLVVNQDDTIEKRRVI